jgi:hypothetical protein
MWHDIHMTFHEDCYRRSRILRFCLSNLNDCNVGITDERDEMGSGVMMYIPSCIKIGSDIQNLIGVRHRQKGAPIRLFSFFSK